MPGWKRRIFVRVIKARMVAEEATREEIMAEYPKFTEEEKSILRAEIPETL